MRLLIRANCWLGIVSIITLVMSVLTSPIRVPQASDARVDQSFLCRNFARVTSDTRHAMTSVTVACAAIDSEDSDFIEEKDEDESFWSFSNLLPSTFLPSASRSQALLGSPPGSITPKISSLRLRC